MQSELCDPYIAFARNKNLHTLNATHQYFICFCFEHMDCCKTLQLCYKTTLLTMVAEGSHVWFQDLKYFGLHKRTNA